MIARIWHGYTTHANAALYEILLKQEVFPNIEDKNVKGYRRIQLLKRDLEDEAEFTTIMWFDTLESVKCFAGREYEMPYVPESARKLLSRFDAKSSHSELCHELAYDL